MLGTQGADVLAAVARHADLATYRPPPGTAKAAVRHRRGRRGAVWRGHHLKLDRAMALKVLDETLQLRTDGRERFIREGKALARLNNRNVVSIYDCDQLADGKLFLCMELLDGDTLRALINRGVQPDPLEVIDIGLQVCDAIEAAHKRGILHRDLTPSNIMRLRDPAKTIKVIP